MTAGQARQIARQWVMEEATGLPGCRGAYTAGSTNWLPDDALFPASSDFDIMIVLAHPDRAVKRAKFPYRQVVIEASYLSSEQFCSPERILRDYHLAPSFATSSILLDPSGHLTSLRACVSRNYTNRHCIRERCAHASARVLSHLGSIDENASLDDRVISCLFAAGVTAHILLVAGLQNPTVRARYVAARELLADYGELEFHEAMLELLGTTRMTRERISHHLQSLTGIFDAASQATHAPFPFASDLSPIARPIAIGGSWDLIKRGYHREAMFWIAVTHARCQKVLSNAAPVELPPNLKDSYRDLLSDLGLACLADIRRRSSEIARFLPRVSEAAEKIMAANQQLED